MIRVTIAPREQNTRVMNGVTRYLFGVLAHGDPDSLDIDLRVLHQGREMPASEWLDQYPLLMQSTHWTQKLDRTFLRPLALYWSRASVIHFPLGWLPKGWELGSAAKVITLHGASRLTGSWHSTQHRSSRELLKKQLLSGPAKLARIVTGSQWSKGEIVKAYDLRHEQVEVIPYGVDLTEFRPLDDNTEIQHWLREEFGVQRPCLLYVGPCSPRKNTLRLVQAFGYLKRHHHIPHQLMLAGAPGQFLPSVESEVNRLGLADDIIFAGPVSDKALTRLYNGASAFVFPSLYEGFGLPILEAMACGTPVVTSNCTALPEVAGGAAALVDDPMDVDNIADVIQRVLEDLSYRELLRQRGLDRAREFTWEACATKHLELYRQVTEKWEGGSN